MPDTKWTDPHCNVCNTRLSRSCGETGPGCGAEILPDWADIREAARNAGYRLRRRGPVDTPSPRTKVVHWDLEPINRNPDGDLGGGFNLVHWWQFRDGEEDAGITVEIDLDDYNGTEAHVWDATPAQAMHGLRLVGLGGGE